MLKKSPGSKSTILALVIAMALASISATSVFAAGSTKLTRSQKQLRQDQAYTWQEDLSDLRYEKAVMDSRVALWAKNWLKDNTTASDRTDATDLINRFNVTLANAEAVVAKHAGFSVNGTVTDPIQADKSLDELNADLHLLRGAITDHILDMFVL